MHTPDRVRTLPGLVTPKNEVEGVQFAGYASVRGATGTNGADAQDEGLFYWFVGTEDYADRPTILWTNGGPGSSSFWGFFLENGPYEIESAVGGPVVRPREHAWNRHANFMIVEHPLSVTLSFAKDPADIPKTVEQGIDQYYQSLLNFLEKHPEIARKPILLAGESYAGTYLPLLAQAIVKGNARPSGVHLDLRGVVLADAWVDPDVQMAANTAYAFHRGLISAAQKIELDKLPLDKVNEAIQAICGRYMANLGQTGDPPFDPVLGFLNNADVRAAIHAAPLGPDTEVTQTWSKAIDDNYKPRVNESYFKLVQTLLEDHGVRFAIVSGLDDAKDCNFLGTAAWLRRLEGHQADAFRAADTHQWLDPVTKRVLGYEQRGGRLSWLKVLDAGHLAVLDQPKVIDYLVRLFQL
jgi:vitellogenic carboxypeptidase-like protein